MTSSLEALAVEFTLHMPANAEQRVVETIQSAGHFAISDIERAIAHLVTERCDAALDVLACVLGGLPITPASKLSVAEVFLKNGAALHIDALVRAALSVSPNAPNRVGRAVLQAAANLANVDLRNRVIAVLLDVARADEGSPNWPGRLRLMAAAFLVLGRHSHAKHLLEQLLTSAPLDQNVVEMLAEAEVGLKNTESAVGALEYARALSYTGRKPKMRSVDKTPTLLLVGQRANIRALKIARFLRPLGWRVVMLCMRIENDERGVFDSIHFYRDDPEAVRIAKTIQADVTHFLCTMIDYAACAMAIAQGLAPVVADVYDVINEMLTEDYFVRNPAIAALRPLEHYVMENAHGLCMRNLQPQVMKRQGKLNLRNPVLFFPEYAWGDVVRQPKLSAQDGVLRVAYAGGVGDEYLFFCRVAERYGFHFHLYPFYDAKAWTTSFEDLFRVYVDEASRNPLFHLHRPIFGSDFLPEISRYDVQLNIDFVVMQDEKTHRPEKIRYGYANKYSDCIDADLVFVSNAGSFCVQLGRRYGLTAGVDRATLETRSFWDGLREQACTADFIRARREWSMERQITRLDRFYQDLIARV